MHMQGGPRGFVTFCNRMVVFGKVTTLLKFLGTIIGNGLQTCHTLLIVQPVRMKTLFH